MSWFFILFFFLRFFFVFHRAPRKHIVDTDIHFYHVPSHGDASRKRIMEDTEDWRPRSGTTQSRSFRILAQITGTESGRNSQTHSDIEIFSLTGLEVFFWVNHSIGFWPLLTSKWWWDFYFSKISTFVCLPLLSQLKKRKMIQPKRISKCMTTRIIPLYSDSPILELLC